MLTALMTVLDGVELLVESNGGGADVTTVRVQQYRSTGPKLSRYRKPMKSIVPAKRSI